MRVDGRDGLERELRSLHERQDLVAVASLALEGYGAEILGLLLAVLRDHDAASEVYAEFSANMWQALPKFRWQSSFRTWAYTLARNAACRYRRDPLRRRAVMVGDGTVLDDLPQMSRTATATFMKTDAKQGISAVRSALDPEDQMLLVLRVDRGLAWDEIASIMACVPDGCDTESETSAVRTRKRAAATLRKRFERVKGEIRSRVTASHPAAE